MKKKPDELDELLARVHRSALAALNRALPPKEIEKRLAAIKRRAGSLTEQGSDGPTRCEG